MWHFYDRLLWNLSRIFYKRARIFYKNDYLYSLPMRADLEHWARRRDQGRSLRGRATEPKASAGRWSASVYISRIGALLVPSNNTCDHLCEEPGECRLDSGTLLQRGAPTAPPLRCDIVIGTRPEAPRPAFGPGRHDHDDGRCGSPRCGRRRRAPSRWSDQQAN
jgi:hypothetical protein